MSVQEIFLEKILTKQLRLFITRISSAELTLNYFKPNIKKLHKVIKIILNLPSATQVIWFNGNQLIAKYTSRDLKCQICSVNFSNKLIRLIMHCLIFHSYDYQFNFQINNESKEITIHKTIFRQSEPYQEKYFSFIGNSNQTYNIVFLMEQILIRMNLMKFVIEIPKRKIDFKTKGIAKDLIERKTFYHGPQKNYAPITTIEEFFENSDDDIDQNFEIQNEEKSLQNDFWELTPHQQQVWQKWNQIVLEKKLKEKRLIRIDHCFELCRELLNYFNIIDYNLKAVIIQHFVCLLNYQFLKIWEFKKLIELI